METPERNLNNRRSTPFFARCVHLLMNERHHRPGAGSEIHADTEGSWSWWLCPVISLAFAGAIALLFGLSAWTILLIAVLLACPVVMIWTYVMGQRPLPVPLGPTPATGGDTRYFNWIAPWYDLQCSIFGLGRSFRDWTLSVARAELRAGDHVLDAGCGNGVLTRPIADIVGPSGQVWGIDPAPDMLRMAMQAGSRTGNAAHFKLAAIEQLPFAGASFDAAIISLVLHHLPPELKLRGLKEVHRVLKPDGRLLVVEADRPDHWIWRILTWPMRLYGNMKDHLEGRTQQLLTEADFVSVTERGRWGHAITFWSARKAS